MVSHEHSIEEIRDLWLAHRGADGSDWEQALGAVYSFGAISGRAARADEIDDLKAQLAETQVHGLRQAQEAMAEIARLTQTVMERDAALMMAKRHELRVTHETALELGRLVGELEEKTTALAVAHEALEQINRRAQGRVNECRGIVVEGEHLPTLATLAGIALSSAAALSAPALARAAEELRLLRELEQESNRCDDDPEANMPIGFWSVVRQLQAFRERKL